jgi:NAD-dependent SIR2 family protein deacetylase
MIRDIFILLLTAEPTAFYKLLADLTRKDCLLRLYTQNINCIKTRLSGLIIIAPLPNYGL